MNQNLVSIDEASKWATDYLFKDISSSNISYLIQYGKVKKYSGHGSTYVNIEDLKNYYKSYNGYREIKWKEKLGQDLNWRLSFDHLKEKDTTKHVHRLHPYKGKFIPQLVEYFIDDHTDNFKKDVYFKTSLPVGVELTGKESVTIGPKISYDKTSRTITWNHSELPANSYTGIYFEVQVTPIVSQIGKEIKLTNDLYFTATDNWTGKKFDLKNFSLNNVLQANDKGNKKGYLVQ